MAHRIGRAIYLLCYIYYYYSFMVETFDKNLNNLVSGNNTLGFCGFKRSDSTKKLFKIFFDRYSNVNLHWIKLSRKKQNEFPVASLY